MNFIKFADSPDWANIVKFGEPQWYTVIVIEVVILISLAAWRILLEDDNVNATVTEKASSPDIPSEEQSHVYETQSTTSTSHPLADSKHKVAEAEEVKQTSPKKSSVGPVSAPPTPDTGRRSGRSRTPNRQNRSPSPGSATKSGANATPKRYGTRGSTPTRRIVAERSPTPSKRVSRK